MLRLEMCMDLAGLQPPGSSSCARGSLEIGRVLKFVLCGVFPGSIPQRNAFQQQTAINSLSPGSKDEADVHF